MDPDTWIPLKGALLAAGTARITGRPADLFIARSVAGPGAGGEGSVFISIDGRRVRLDLTSDGDILIDHLGDGAVRVTVRGEEYAGILERPALHCPGQAFITVTASCIFSCRYCSVPSLQGRRRTPEEIEAMVASVMGTISAIALTSGVLESIAEEEEYVCGIVSRLTRFALPIGVSIYPGSETSCRLHQAGAVEVKYNLEAATPALFAEMCPGLPDGSLREILRDAVSIFGRGHVFSNVILGLGETDTEMEACLESLCADGVIPVVRPLHPHAGLAHLSRPPADRIIRTCLFLSGRLREHGLNPGMALTMCPACTGCDLIPGRDD